MYNNKKDSINFKSDFLKPYDINTIFLKQKYSKKGIKRICFHKDEKSKIHIMILKVKKDYVYPKHSHKDGDEFINILKGKMRITFYQNKKKKSHVLSDKKFSQIIIKKNTPHTTEVLTNYCIYLEVKKGPFNRKNISFK